MLRVADKLATKITIIDIWSNSIIMNSIHRHGILVFYCCQFLGQKGQSLGPDQLFDEWVIDYKNNLKIELSSGHLNGIFKLYQFSWKNER